MSRCREPSEPGPAVGPRRAFVGHPPRRRQCSTSRSGSSRSNSTVSRSSTSARTRWYCDSSNGTSTPSRSKPSTPCSRFIRRSSSVQADPQFPEKDMRGLRLTLMLLACAFATGAAADYPDKPIRLVVPQAAGSATDTVARIMGAELAKEIGQQVVVDNRPGGALTLGLDITAKSDPDGYTICMGPIGALAITRHMVSKLPYDIERDFQPIALATRGHLLLAVSPTVPFKSVAELIAYAKDHPGKLLNASASNGSPGHVGGELFKYMSGTDIVHVPYRGGAAAINDLIAGRVHLMFESLNSIAPHARSGAVRALAVSGARRSRRDVQGSLCDDRRRAGGRHAGRVRRADPRGFGQVGRGRQTFGRSARL